jgi:chromosome segregation ATPase
MTIQSDIARVILSQAETQIVRLKSQLDQNEKMFTEMAENELALEQQIILLNAQIQDLEELLYQSNEELAGTGNVLKQIHAAMAQLKNSSLAALKHVNDNSSKAQMAVTLCELAAKSKMSNEVQFLEDAQRQIEALRARLQRK